jgi:hypothetical protein
MPMADHVQLELFDLKTYTSGKSTPGINVLTQVEEVWEIEHEQLELDLFPNVPVLSYFNLKRVA